MLLIHVIAHCSICHKRLSDDLPVVVDYRMFFEQVNDPEYCGMILYARFPVVYTGG